MGKVLVDISRAVEMLGEASRARIAIAHSERKSITVGRTTVFIGVMVFWVFWNYLDEKKGCLDRCVQESKSNVCGKCMEG